MKSITFNSWLKIMYNLPTLYNFFYNINHKALLGFVQYRKDRQIKRVDKPKLLFFLWRLLSTGKRGYERGTDINHNKIYILNLCWHLPGFFIFTLSYNNIYLYDASIFLLFCNQWIGTWRRERVYVALAGEMGAALRDRINYKKAPNTVRKS